MLNHATHKVCTLAKVCMIFLLTPLFSTAGSDPLLVTKAATASAHRFTSACTNDQMQQLRTNFYKVDANNVPVALVDGDLTLYSESFSNNIDAMDVRKMSNFTENLGMLREGQVLAIETRKVITTTDTIFFKMWQLHQQRYRFDFIATDMSTPGLSAFMEDAYLHTTTPVNLSGNTTILFDVTADAGSYSTDRFRIVFINPEMLAGIVPVRYTNINAFQRSVGIAVEWTVDNEIAMKQYEVEYAADGRHFSNINTTTPTGSNNGRITYTAIHNTPAKGNNFYRIKGTSLSGKVEYSPIVKVVTDQSNTGIAIYPNPIKGNQINLQFSNQAPGKYKVRLINYTGQPVYKSEIDLGAGNTTYPIQLTQKLATGYYQLEVTKGTEVRMVQRVVID